MRVIDIDPQLLKRGAEAASHAGYEGVRHVTSEIAGDVGEILKTLAPQGPYGYTVRQQVNPDGTLQVPIQSTLEEIHEEYKFVRGMCDVLTHKPVIDVRGNWYLFQEVVNTGCLKSTPDKVGRNETLVLLPCASTGGITGEIFWYRVPRNSLGQGPDPVNQITDPIDIRVDNMERHDRYMAALAAGNVDGMLAEMNASVQLCVRDYVTESGTLTSPGSKETYGPWWRSFFDKYDVQSIDMLERVIQEWYVFAELRLNLRRRDNDKSVAFHTAEFFIPAKDGSFIAQIGHGSDEAVMR
jgi:hypothetical protein